LKNRLLRLVSGTLVIICAAAPGSATVTRATTTRQSKVNLSPPLTRGTRLVRTGDARGQVVVKGPSGCTSSGPYSFTGGGYGNYPGGTAAGILAGTNNESCDALSGIAAGNGNLIGGDGSSSASTIGAGYFNGIEAEEAFIGGGGSNEIGLSPPWYNSDDSAIVAGVNNTVASAISFIGAGNFNKIFSPSSSSSGFASSFIGAGNNNTIVSDFSVITGGYGNSNTGEYGTIGGGYNNVVSGIQASVGGGYGNAASGRNAAVPGGAYNTAGGLDSFAAGNAAKATYNGTFVWSDYSAISGITSTAANQFLARAAGGFFLYSSANLKSGVKLAPGSGSWSSLSDRASKTGIENVNDARILAKVASLPVSEWSYTEQGTGVRHLGPMAQDFRAAFGLGEDDKHISAVDEEGIALAAIKALQAAVVEKDRQLADNARKIDDLDSKYARLEQRLESVEKANGV
jgi:hypothetical protein